MIDAKRILIVARPYDAEVMRRALAEAGYETSLAAWGSQGCEQVERERPGAVVLSTRRAEEESAGFLNDLRVGEYGQSVAVVVVAEPGSRLATTELKADRLLLRPLDISALVASVRALIGGPQAVLPLPPEDPSLPVAAAPQPQPVRKGSLREVDPARLVANAHRDGITGALILVRGEAEKRIAFDAGEPVFASSNQSYDRLSDLLFREGKITRAQYRLCEDGLSDSGRRMGAILVDRGLIKARELFPLVRRQVAEIIYSVFSWTDGNYEIRVGEQPPDEKIKLDLPTSVLVLEGVRRKYGLDRLMDLLGPPESCLLALPSAASLAREAGLSTAERACLELLDGRHTLQEVTTRTGLGELPLYQFAYAALALGAVSVRGAGEVRTIAAAERVPAAQQRELAIDRQRVEAKYAQVVEADYFTLLGVTSEVSAHEVLRAYQRACEEFRPEAFAPEVRKSLAPQLAEIAEVLEEAYRILSDETLRRCYREAVG